MYIPAPFGSRDPAVAWDLVRRHPLGLLVTDPLDVAPLPWIADEASQRLLAHVAAADAPVHAAFGRRVLVAFRGPDAYVSPRWYGRPEEHVPTWNYVVACAEGTLEPLSREATSELLWRMCERFEGPDGYRPSRLDPALWEELRREITGVEVRVLRFEAKVKLSQNRSQDDRRRVIEGLRTRGAGLDAEVARWMTGGVAPSVGAGPRPCAE
jgi:transcriptional regulator